MGFFCTLFLGLAMLYLVSGLNMKRTTFPFQEVYHADPNYKEYNLLTPSTNNYIPNHKRHNETHTEIIFVKPPPTAPVPDNFPDFKHFEYEYDYPWQEIRDDFLVNEKYNFPTTPTTTTTSTTTSGTTTTTATTTLPQELEELFSGEYEDIDLGEPDEPFLFAPVGTQRFQDGPPGLFRDIPHSTLSYHPSLVPLRAHLFPIREDILPNLKYASIPRPTPKVPKISFLGPQIPQFEKSPKPKPKLRFHAHYQPFQHDIPKKTAERPNVKYPGTQHLISSSKRIRGYLPPLSIVDSTRRPISNPQISGRMPIPEHKNVKKPEKKHQKSKTKNKRFENRLFNAIQPYNYSYKVRNDDFKVNFGAQENSDGFETQGHYYVTLPDGRLQVVNYSSNNETGYLADISYHGP